jgi:regulatory protein
LQVVDSAAQPAGLPGGVDRALVARALAWLAQREYSRLELRNKLLRHRPQSGSAGRGGAQHAPGVASGASACAPPVLEPEAEPVDGRTQAQRVDAVLDWLERHQHLSQQRFAESRLHLRSARFGNARIRQELAQHGVALSAEIEASLRASEIDRARAVWERKYGGRATEAAEAAKQVRFLAGRGFSGDVIRRVLREAESTRATDQSANTVRPPKAPVDDLLAEAGESIVHPRSGRRLHLVAGGSKKPLID